MDKALITNLVALILVVLGLFLDSSWPGQALILDTGLFALSGGMTNWLAVHMLFEKVPGFYGSGVIPSRFEEFKRGIKTLMMEQFFTPANIELFLSRAGSAEAQGGEGVVRKLADKVNFDGAYDALVDVIMNSSFGGMLAMLGGASALNPLRQPFADKMREYLQQLAEDREFLAQFRQDTGATLLDRVELIVDRRLDELTPQMVKDIIQQMIRKHLGWLVVWGGVIGGVIGLLVSLFL